MSYTNGFLVFKPHQCRIDFVELNDLPVMTIWQCKTCGSRWTRIAWGRASDDYGWKRQTHHDVNGHAYGDPGPIAIRPETEEVR
jgi:hypothetical protein